jgi:hypothetical protein
VAAETAQRHGSGLVGRATLAGRITACSLVRGSWEVRLARVDSLEPGLEASELELRVGGWPIAAATAPGSAVSQRASSVDSGGVASRLHALVGDASAGVEVRTEASPLGDFAAVPTLSFAVEVGEWTASLVELSGAPLQAQEATVSLGADSIVVGWPDGHRTTTDFAHVRSVLATDRHSERAPKEVRGQLQRSTKE